MKSCAPATLAVVMGALVAVAPATAANNRWSTIGPYGGVITTLVVHPSQPAIAYAGTFGNGVFKSVNGGASWSPASEGLPLRAAVTSLALDPSRPQTLYAGTYEGLYRSLDGGAHWTATGAQGLISQVAVSPANPGVVYAISQLHHLVRSDDCGVTWRVVPPPHPGFYPDLLVASPASADTLFVSSQGSSPPSLHQAEIYRTTDGGGTWVPVATGLTAPPFAPMRFALAVAPDRPQTVYAALVVYDFDRDVSSLAKSTDGGTTWTPAAGAGGFPVLTLPGGRVLTDRAASTDYGDTWTSLPRVEKRTLAIAASPARPATVLLLADRGGIFKSTDAGRTYTSSNHGLAATGVTSLTMGSNSTLYAAVAGEGLFTRPWQAGGWDQLLSEIPGREGSYFNSNLVAVHPRRPRVMLATVTQDIDEGLFRTADGGLTWTYLGSLDAADSVTDLAFDPVEPNRILAAGSGSATGCGSWRSTDRGTTWACLPLGVTVDFEFDPIDPRNVYAAGDRLSKSTDRGLTWKQNGLGRGLPQDSRPAQLVHAPAAGQLFLATEDGRLFRSTDGARSWRPAQGNLPRRAGLSLAIDPRDPARIYAAIPGSGVYRSRDGGRRWQALNTGITGTALSANGSRTLPPVIDPRDRATLYLGTGNRGVLAFTQTN